MKRGKIRPIQSSFLGGGDVIPAIRRLSCLACLILAGALVTGAQLLPDSAPEPKPKPKLPPTLKVTTDLTCDWRLDGVSRGRLETGDTLTVRVSPGEHLMQAASTDGKDHWETSVVVGQSGQKAIRILLSGIQQARQQQEKEQKETAERRLAEERKRQEASLLVTTDLDCSWTLDGVPQGKMKAHEVKTVRLAAGEHLVHAISIDGQDAWQTLVDVGQAGQKALQILLSGVRQARQEKEQKEAAERKLQDERKREEARKQEELRRKEEARKLESQEWEAARSSNDRNRLEAFLQRYPAGPFSDAARAQIEQIDWTTASGSNDRSKLQTYLNQHNNGKYAQQAREQIEQIDWNAASSSHDRARLQGYLAQYHNGRYAQQAREALQQIGQEEARKPETQEWEAVKSSNDRTRLEGFVQRYPTGPFAETARSLIEQIDWTAANGSSDRFKLEAYLDQHKGGKYAQQAGEQIEQIDWEYASSSHDRARLQSYIDKYGNSRNVQQAREMLEEIDWTAAKDSGDTQRLQAFLSAHPQGRYMAAAKATFDAISARTTIDTGVVAPPVPAPQAQKHPDYCPLPSQLAFDLNTPHSEKIGIWTGKWEHEKSDFCIVITSITNESVQGFYSYQEWGSNGRASYFPIKGRMKSPTIIYVRGIDGNAKQAPTSPREVTLEFREGKPVRATLFYSYPHATVYDCCSYDAVVQRFR